MAQIIIVTPDYDKQRQALSIGIDGLWDFLSHGGAVEIVWR